MRFWAALLLVVASACGPCAGRDDLQWAGLRAIEFRISKDDAEVFGSEDSRKSLQISSLERQQAVEFSFIGSNLYINDDSYDAMAHDDLICPSYVLKYNTDDTDTLKICYKIRKDKCGGTEFEEVRPFWNEVLMEYSNNFVTIK